jgi:tRNA dimethylallyltransferase
MSGGNRADGDPVRAILIAGPTASGKSALALHLAARLGGVVVNADSMQVYRELRILTARPGPADEARVPHHLYGFVSVAEAFSVGRWIDAARAALDAAWAGGRLPIVVGGTGLYFHALTTGLSAIPDVPADVRAGARDLLDRLGPAGLHARLAERDPAGAARLRPSDPQRIARAWEVLEATGRPLAHWQATTLPGPLAQGALRLLLAPPRAEVYARCDARLGGMIDAGALDEVRALDRLGLPAQRPAMRALGVPHLLRHVRGEAGLEEALDAARTATRRYAKRQMTWFRHRMADWHRLEQDDRAELAAAIDGLLPAG